MKDDLQYGKSKVTTHLGDFLWFALTICIACVLVLPKTQTMVVAITKQHPYIMGFIKFAILATMGELLAIRVMKQRWKSPAGLVYRATVWGLIGASLVVIFGVFSQGVEAIINQGLLPGSKARSVLVTALWVSFINNIAFAPTLMLFHRITDTYLDLAGGQLSAIRRVRLAQVAKTIDWQAFLDFVIFKTIPFFWIPAHTITFSLPPEFRIVFAAFLSIAFGGIMAFAKRKTRLSSA